MRLFKKILLVLIILGILAYAAFYIFINTRAKQIVVEKLRDVTGRQVEVKAVRMSNPWRIKVEDLRIEGIGRAAAVELSPSIAGFLSGRLLLYSAVVSGAEVTFLKPSSQPQPQSQDVQAVSAPAGPDVPVSGKKITPLVFYRLEIRDSTFTYVDKDISAEGITMTFTGVNAAITNAYQFPKDLVTKFIITADIPWNDSKEKGVLSLDGWINIFKKDMMAKLALKDIDALYLYPYYASWFNLDKSSIEKAKLSFSSDITGLNNDVTAACHLEVTEMGFKQHEEPSDQTRAEKIAQKVLELFKSMNNGRVVLNFNIKTKMDSPSFGLNVIKSAFENMIMSARKKRSTAAKVMEVPGQVVGGTVKGVSDVSSALIGGVVSVGKELGKSLGASFKRESAESPAPAENETTSQPEIAAQPESLPQPVTPPEPPKVAAAPAQQPAAVVEDANATLSKIVEENLSQVQKAQDIANATVNGTVSNTTEE